MTAGQPDDVTLQEGQVPPSQEQGGHGEQKVTWLELFYDLIFVVAFDQLAKRLGDAPQLAQLGVFTLLFGAVWWSWASNAVYASRYGNESRAYRWGTLAQLVTMSMIALTLRGDLVDTGRAFALAFGVNRVLQALQSLHAAREEGEAFPWRLAGSQGLAGGMWLASAALPGGSGGQLGLWGVALAVEVLTPVFTRAHAHARLPHEGHLPERVGLLQIIALGAIVTEVVTGGRKQALTWATLVPALAAILTVVGLWRLYFDQARALPLLAAHVEGQVGRMLSWLYGHLPFTLAVVMVGVGLGHGISDVDAKKDAVSQQWVAWPLAGALIALVGLRANSLIVTHRARPRDRSIWVMLAAAGAAAGLAALDLDTVQLHLLAAGVTLLAAFLVATDPVTTRLGRLEEVVADRLEEGSAPDSLEPEVVEALQDEPDAPRVEGTSGNPPTNSATRRS